MHPLEAVCCTQFSGIRKELVYEKTPNLGLGIPYSQSVSRNWLFWRETCFERQALALSPDISIDGLVHSCWLQAFAFMVVEHNLDRKKKRMPVATLDPKLTRHKKWAAERKQDRVCSLPLHPGIYNLPLPISLPARLHLDWEWAEAGKQAAVTEAREPSQDSQRAVSRGHTHFFLLEEGSR